MSADILRILVVLLAIVVVSVVLIQQPKDGGMSAFTGGGGGASSTVFGAKGSGSFFFKLTAGAALLFAILIIALVKVTNSDLGGSVLSTPITVEENVIPGQDTSVPNTEQHLPAVKSAENSEIPGAVNTGINAQKSVEKDAEQATQQ